MTAKCNKSDRLANEMMEKLRFVTVSTASMVFLLPLLSRFPFSIVLHRLSLHSRSKVVKCKERQRVECSESVESTRMNWHEEKKNIYNKRMK